MLEGTSALKHTGLRRVGSRQIQCHSQHILLYIPSGILGSGLLLMSADDGDIVVDAAAIPQFVAAVGEGLGRVDHIARIYHLHLIMSHHKKRTNVVMIVALVVVQVYNFQKILNNLGFVGRTCT